VQLLPLTHGINTQIAFAPMVLISSLLQWSIKWHPCI